MRDAVSDVANPGWTIGELALSSYGAPVEAASDPDIYLGPRSVLALLLQLLNLTL
ncbi:MAG: hypothetical protein ABJB12_05895 [Pseudomonadota bacterium]